MKTFWDFALCIIAVDRSFRVFFFAIVNNPLETVMKCYDAKIFKVQGCP
jgi:hypothetical protein